MTAILASFAGHGAKSEPVSVDCVDIVQALGAFVVASALSLSSAMLGTSDNNPLSKARSAPSFLSKRGVVAFRRRSLRSVVSECGPNPKDVLSKTFAKLRRTASTTSSKRMSWRFARTPQEERSLREHLSDGFEAGARSPDWGWRSVGDVAGDVVRNAIVAAALAKAR